jgi:NADH-quinone oxidoreductase subunit N
MTGNDLLALTPILILALGSATILLISAWHHGSRLPQLTGVVLALAAAAAAALLIPPTEQIAGLFSAGLYARFFTVLWSLVAALTLLLSRRYIEEQHFAAGEYTCLVLFSAAGMSLLSASTSFVGLFLGLESFTLVLYILIAFDKKNPAGAEAGLKYLVPGAVATGFLAFGIALLYTAAGTFHIPAAMLAIGSGGDMQALGVVGMVMLLVAVSFKVSLAPFHFWTPDVYQGAPAPISGLLSTGSKGAVYAALITLLAGVPLAGGSLAGIFWGLAALSMVVGTLTALRQSNIKRMLAYSSVVHMGYVLLALLAGGSDGRSAAVFYLVVYTASTLGAFAVITSFASNGHEPQETEDFRGVGFRDPFRCAALAIFLVSLAGIPPAAGFVGKFGVFHAAIRADLTALAIIGILSSLVSLFYYLRFVVAMYTTAERSALVHFGTLEENTVLAVCVAATLILGVFPGHLLDLIARILP